MWRCRKLPVYKVDKNIYTSADFFQLHRFLLLWPFTKLLWQQNKKVSLSNFTDVPHFSHTSFFPATHRTNLKKFKISSLLNLLAWKTRHWSPWVHCLYKDSFPSWNRWIWTVHFLLSQIFHVVTLKPDIVALVTCDVIPLTLGKKTSVVGFCLLSDRYVFTMRTNKVCSPSEIA